MKPEIKKKWIDALRSGEYQQTKNVLHDDDGFCCLGLLTELFRQEKGGEWVKDLPDSNEYTFVNPVYWDGREYDILPWTVVNWAGLKNQVPSVAEGYLSNLNDNGLSFSEIADLIEEQL